MGSSNVGKAAEMTGVADRTGSDSRYDTAAVGFSSHVRGVTFSTSYSITRVYIHNTRHS